VKTLLACLALLPFAAQADTLTYLQHPAPPPQRWTCASTGFTDDGLTVLGKCQLSIPGRAKYQQPERDIYDVTWTADGTVTQGALYCQSPAHMGVDHSGCPQIVTFSDTNVVVQIDGYNFWYVSTNVYGAEAVNNQTDTYLWQP
jgi:hypothetical protein